MKISIALSLVALCVSIAASLFLYFVYVPNMVKSVAPPPETPAPPFRVRNDGTVEFDKRIVAKGGISLIGQNAGIVWNGRELFGQGEEIPLTVSHFEVPLVAAKEAPKDAEFVPISTLAEGGRFDKTYPQKYGDEVVAAIMVPSANFETNPSPFWTYSAEPANVNQVRIRAHGLRPGGQFFKIYVFYRK